MEKRKVSKEREAGTALVLHLTNATQLWKMRPCATVNSASTGQSAEWAVSSCGSCRKFLIFPHSRHFPWPGSCIFKILKSWEAEHSLLFCPYYRKKEKRAWNYFWNRDDLLKFIFKVFKGYLGQAHNLRKSVRGASFWTLA